MASSWPTTAAKGGELDGAFFHGRMIGEGGMGQVHDVLVTAGIFVHALWPPICWFRSMVMASSCRFDALRMAFLPYLCLMASIAC